MMERTVSFGDGHRLSGVVTPTAGPAHGADGVILLNSGIIHRVGPNRLHVELARRLAAEGYPVLRFDAGGIGDSGPPRGTDLFAGMMADIADAVDVLTTSTGASRVVLAGLCSGADNGLTAAVRDPRVAGLVLMDPTTFRTRGFYRRLLLAKLRDRRSWAHLFSGSSAVWSPLRALGRRLTGRVDPDVAPRPPAFYGMSSMSREETRDALRALVARDVRLLYVFTGGVQHRYNYPGQLRDAFQDVAFHDQLRVAHYPDSDHTFTRREHRARLAFLVLDWLREAGFRPASPSSAPRVTLAHATRSDQLTS